MERQKTGKKSGRMFRLQTALLLFMVLPATALTLMVPSSWYSVEGYENLGIMEFEAYKWKSQGK